MLLINSPRMPVGASWARTSCGANSETNANNATSLRIEASGCGGWFTARERAQSQPDSSSSRVSDTAVLQSAAISSSGRTYRPAKLPSPSRSRIAAGPRWVQAAHGTAGFAALGAVTPGSRVHGKFSIHDACDARGSSDWTCAHTRGAFHQLWNLTRMPG